MKNNNTEKKKEPVKKENPHRQDIDEGKARGNIRDEKTIK